MKLIGISGKAGSGKNFVADIIKESFNNVEIFSFAEKLKRTCMALFNLSEDDVFSREGKKRITKWKWEDFNKNINHGKTGLMTVREIQQFVGTEVVRNQLNGNHWITLVEDKVLTRNADVSVISDRRFENEGKFVEKYDGLNINVYGRQDTDVPLHCSELNLLRHDHEIYNGEETTEAELKEKVISIIMQKWPELNINKK